MLAKTILLRLLLASCFLFLINILFAQKTVSGKITDATTGKPVVGSTVALRGSNVATETNAEGDFTISVPNDKSRLLISSVGYETQDVPVAGKSNLSVTMK